MEIILQEFHNKLGIKIMYYKNYKRFLRLTLFILDQYFWYNKRILQFTIFFAGECGGIWHNKVTSNARCHFANGLPLFLNKERRAWLIELAKYLSNRIIANMYRRLHRGIIECGGKGKRQQSEANVLWNRILSVPRTLPGSEGRK